MGFIHAHARPYLQGLESGSPIVLTKRSFTVFPLTPCAGPAAV